MCAVRVHANTTLGPVCNIVLQHEDRSADGCRYLYRLCVQRKGQVGKEQGGTQVGGRSLHLRAHHHPILLQSPWADSLTTPPSPNYAASALPLPYFTGSRMYIIHHTFQKPRCSLESTALYSCPGPSRDCDVVVTAYHCANEPGHSYSRYRHCDQVIHVVGGTVASAISVKITLILHST